MSQNTPILENHYYTISNDESPSHPMKLSFTTDMLTDHDGQSEYLYQPKVYHQPNHGMDIWILGTYPKGDGYQFYIKHGVEKFHPFYLAYDGTNLAMWQDPYPWWLIGVPGKLDHYVIRGRDNSSLKCPALEDYVTTGDDTKASAQDIGSFSWKIAGSGPPPQPTA